MRNKTSAENNLVTIAGKVISKCQFNHKVLDNAFYTFDMLVERLSGTEDIIPMMISAQLTDVSRDFREHNILVTGRLRSYNRYEGGKSKLELSVFAKHMEWIDRINENTGSNRIYLEGFVCKPPVYRRTRTRRHITELLLAVNKSHGKADYIPCVCWGIAARYAAGFITGDHCAVWGRIQSREYWKKVAEGLRDKQTACEVSVKVLEMLP